MRNDFEIAAVEVTPKHHPAIERLAIVDHRPAVNVDNGLALGIPNLLPGISKVPVQLAIGAEHERMIGMVVLVLAGLGEHCHLAISDIITIIVDQAPDI